ncbi:MAG: hypothetical protein J6W90_00660, partial [Verrucomicrobia bacterium]|nr:hypothetical protein [Verrucomicrobiota bacterium]
DSPMNSPGTGDRTERQHHTEYHPSVTPSGFDFVGNRYRGFRFAPSPAVICRPIGTQRMSRAHAAVIYIPKGSFLKA